jgi:hypothetical protein
MTDPPTPLNLATLFTTLLRNTDTTACAALLLALQNHTSNSPAHAPPPPPPVTTVATASTTFTGNFYDDDPKDPHILSQSDVAPQSFKPTFLPTRINPSFSIITSFLEEQPTTHKNAIKVQSRRLNDGHIINCHDACKHLHIVLKIAMPANANSDQASTTSMLEEVINTIIDSSPSPSM